MGDKAILTGVLEAADLTDAYSHITPKHLIDDLRHRDGESSNDQTASTGILKDQVDFGSMHDGASPDTFTVDQAVEAIGLGRYQIGLSILSGIGLMADSMEMMILAVLFPALECDWNIDSFQVAMLTTIVFSGMMISSPLWGKICDMYGRRVGLVLSAVITFVFGVLSAFSPSYYWLLFLRGMTGLGIGGLPQTVTMYAEFLPINQRAKCVLLLTLFLGIGSAFEALLALLIMDSYGWQWLLGLSSLPLLIFVVFAIFLLPESARYHVASGQTDLAYATLSRMAKSNGRPMLTGKLIGAPAHSDDNRRGHMVDLFTSEYAMTTALVWFIWCMTAFSYYGIVLFTTKLFQSNDPCHGGVAPTVTDIPLNSTVFNDTNFTSNVVSIIADGDSTCHRLKTNDYVDLLWTSFAEVPGLLATCILIDWIGRKATMGAEFALFSVFTIVLLFCLDRSVVTGFIFVGRAMISSAFTAIWLYTPEVYPTTLRAVAVGTASSCARIGAIITPFIAQVAADTSLVLPICIYGIAGVLSAVAAFLLPIETKGRHMKDNH